MFGLVPRPLATATGSADPGGRIAPGLSTPNEPGSPHAQPPAVILALLLCAGAAHAQVGDLIWEDNFNDLGNWITLTGNGSWGWGNGELEYYLPANVDIAPVPGETGNQALRIVARQESGAGIADQWGNPLNYTSGKVMSKSFVSVRYGMIETRVWVPDLNLGG